MLLLEGHQIVIEIQGNTLLKAEKLTIHQQDRIGLIGKNGTGKSTLLHILARKQKPTKGTINSDVTTFLLPQLKEMVDGKSGGEMTQAYIQQAIQESPTILFADEPTTHLDKEHIEWLEQKLRNWSGAFVIVSHDRAFLDQLCTTIWEIEDSNLNMYNGNYSSYIEQKDHHRSHHHEEYDKYMKEKNKLERAIAGKEKRAAKATKKPKNVSRSEAKITGAKPYFAKKQKKLQQTAKALETRLEKIEEIEKPKDLTELKMEIPNQEAFHGRMIIRVEQLVGQIDNRTLWSKQSFFIYGGEKIAIIGKNGSGKTTLLNQLISPNKEVSISPAVIVGYLSQHLSLLQTKESILMNVKETSKQSETLIRTVLARLHFLGQDVHKPVHVLSGGERVKVALAKLFVSHCNTLILDEPTTFLDIEAVKALEALLQEYEGTVLFVSHDRQFIKSVATKVIEINQKKLHVFAGTYEEYQAHKERPTQNSDDRKLIIETRITEILSLLSISPSDQLEKEFQQLLAEKKKL
ncbi:Vga family ABC-F type ribosomal protection protein [Halalkalibacter sp. APA_J-10(15)]|uniref:Vga family ABC-F type ribosomal protection protein n=1 Tax=Halalkalibacter sp. APA_J-10(15) TaxID=2933805 RepID=UPI001FF2B6AB|nr:ABC-F type ribosomal protection protein [Halalkalibacter sp. APA_J-10(15)]MCK0471834.1 ABC-F type ribosomal protection protein [Halalkalibacter sp. APA_J-10(15)]